MNRHVHDENNDEDYDTNQKPALMRPITEEHHLQYVRFPPQASGRSAPASESSFHHATQTDVKDRAKNITACRDHRLLPAFTFMHPQDKHRGLT